MKNFSLIMALACGVALTLGGCAPLGLATGAAASVGVASAQEGGLSRAGTDARIQIEINDLWFKNNIEMFRKLDLTVNQGRVLITGVVQNPDHRVEAVRLAWQPKGVKQVINEIRVAKSEGIVGYAKDSWITTSLRTQMMFNRDIQSINYSIDTVAGTVYLMGVAQNQKELNRVTNLARKISGVKNVVSYVKLLGAQDETLTPSQGGGSVPTSGGYSQDQAYGGGAPIDIAPQPMYDGAGSDGMNGGSVPAGAVPDATAPTPKQGIEVEVLN